MFEFDAAALKAAGKAAGNVGDMYVVVQVVLTEKFIGTGSGASSLSNLQRAINEQAANVVKDVSLIFCINPIY